MSYCKMKNCWVGLKSYDLNGNTETVENYTPKVTLSLPEWRQYVASGYNTILGSGGVIPGGTVNTGWGGNGAVYRGHVIQGW